MNTINSQPELRRRRRSTRLSWPILSIALLLPIAVAAQTYEVVHGFRSTGKPMSGLVQVGNDLYGTTYYGGTSGVGMIFKLDPQGNLTTLHSFGYADGAFPTAGLIYATDGYFYGTTTAGGLNNLGVVFRMDATGHATALHSFDGTDGSTPNASLIQAGDGDFYGTTSAGGGTGHIGTVFRMNSSGELSVLHRFSTTDGFYPYASLVQGTDGNFYGTTAGGGDYGLGTAFKIDTAGDLTTLHHFKGIYDGADPYAALIQASDGNFYGTTRGGATGCTIYRMTPQGDVTVLYHFQLNDGLDPYAPLVQASDGNLYGVTGIGTIASSIFRLELSGTFTQLYRFDYTDANLYGGLIQANDGDLYGTASAGGNGVRGIGSVFKMDLAGNFTTVYAFASTEPVTPQGRLVEAGGDKLYGTALGGSFGSGLVYRIDQFGSLSVEHSFAGPDGVNPSPALCRTSDDFLYGTTGRGGSNGVGTAFQLQLSGEFATLHNFDFSEGTGPSGLIQGSDGKFYGTAVGGGGSGEYGTAFRMSSSGDVTVLHDFQGPDGMNPDAGLLQAADGDYYGTTPNTLFKLTSDGGFTKLFDFSEDYGTGSKSSLIQLADGHFYGVSASGGASHKGVVYTADALGAVTPIHSFGGGDGSFPQGALVQAADGYLYGTTTTGGAPGGGGGCGWASGCGTIFRIDTSGNFKLVHSFNITDGSSSGSGLSRAADGRLYGTAIAGGPFGGNGAVGPFTGMGVIFRLSSAQIAVNEVSPSSGVGEAGAALTVLGGGFAPGVTVTIGGVDATNVTVADPTFLYLLMPALSPGTYDVTVTAPGGAASATHPAAYVVGGAGPTITSFTPTAGPTNTKVTINGTGFAGVSSVKFNGQAAPFTVLSPTQLTANVSSGATTGKITVKTPVGTATSATDFIVVSKPTVTGFTPGSGVPGTTVVITGTNFDTVSAVAFNGVVWVGATFTINSPTQITATVPSTATTGKIKVTNPAGVAYSVGAFVVPPTITSFSPTSGLAGTKVIINGNTFLHASSVTFNGVAATFTVNSSIKITATVPSGATSGKIAVTTPGGGTATSATNFMVLPKITSFTPTAGPINTNVTINGTGFTGVSSVKFNGKGAASFNVLSPTQLTAKVSAGTTTGKITVKTPAGTATSATNFIVLFPPTVTGFTPGSGVPGTTVVITGTNFDTASAVAFNGFGATFTINSPTQITATVPSTAVTGKIRVTNAAGTGASVGTFVVPTTITSFSPTSGLAGTKVIINGTTFLNANSVTFNGVAANFTINSSLKITATVPSGATSGKIAVTTPGGGTATSATNFTVLP
jgi:uncharacterized repeat protein (TIGR03803 family)